MFKRKSKNKAATFNCEQGVMSHPIVIDWSKAPEWANFLVTDANGDMYWFEKRPEPCIGDGEWYTTLDEQRTSTEGRFGIAKFHLDWNVDIISRIPEDRKSVV